MNETCLQVSVAGFIVQVLSLLGHPLFFCTIGNAWGIRLTDISFIIMTIAIVFIIMIYYTKV